MNEDEKLGRASDNPNHKILPVEIASSISKNLKIPILRHSYGFKGGRLDVDYYHGAGYEIGYTLLDGSTYTIHIDDAVIKLGRNENTGIDTDMLTNLINKSSPAYRGIVPQDDELTENDVEAYLEEMAMSLDVDTHCCECTPGPHLDLPHSVHIQYPNCKCKKEDYVKPEE